MQQRLFDIAFSIAALAFLSPLLFLIVIVLRFTGEGEVLYRQQRIGRNGLPFELLKFATMVKNSPSMGSGDITLKNDPRVLPLGNVLRKTKINELPQLINIVRGDMSIVGPRPHTEKNFLLYSQQTRDIVCMLPPGLTGIGSIVFRDEESILENAVDKISYYQHVIAPYKGELECWYAWNNGLANYFLIIMLTAWYVFRPNSKLIWSVFSDLPKPPNALHVLLGE
jgi:lipopolysaccharide/colanic/teichoic acid biosynthesis glycosyltransferase